MQAMVILDLVIGVTTLVAAAGIGWLAVEDARFRARTRGRHWTASPVVRIAVVQFGPLLGALLVRAICDRSGMPLVQQGGARLASAAALSFWFVALGSAAQNPAISTVAAYPPLARLDAVDSWSSRYLGAWWAVRVLAGTLVAFLNPGVVVVMTVAFLAGVGTTTPYYRTVLGLEPRPTAPAVH